MGLINEQNSLGHFEHRQDWDRKSHSRDAAM
jgi:hypothetical protein